MALEPIYKHFVVDMIHLATWSKRQRSLKYCLVRFIGHVIARMILALKIDILDAMVVQPAFAISHPPYSLLPYSTANFSIPNLH